MYLKLGTIGVNYSTPEIDDFMIYAEVPDTSLSYESPILVRTLDELEIWFGKSMLDYPMLVEILNHGGTLYLYGPTATENRETGILDISGYQEVWADSPLNQTAIPETLLEDNRIPKIPGYKYRVDRGNGLQEWWIWTEDGYWLPESLFPQNMINPSVSLNNRDTLLISIVPLYKSGDYYWYNTETLEKNNFVYAKDPDGVLYRLPSGTYSIGGVDVRVNTSGKVLSDVVIPGIPDPSVTQSNPRYSEDVELGDGVRYPKLESPFDSSDPRATVIVEPNSRGNTFSLKLTYPNDQDIANVPLEDGFFIYTTTSGTTYYYTFGNFSNMNREKLYREYGIPKTAPLNTGARTLGGLVASLSDNRLGSDALGKINTKPGETVLFVVSQKVSGSYMPKGKFTFDGYFYSSNSEIDIEVDSDTNARFLDQYIRGNNWPGMLFWSRTIGRDEDIYDDSRDISLRFENIEDDNVLITVKRYDYTEVFSGKINSSFGEESIEDKINKESKLIRCYISGSDSFILPETQEYKLSGAVENKSLSGSYWKSLYTLLDPPGETVCPDFVLIPYLFYWPGRDDKDWKELGERYNTQFIVSEKYPYQVEGNLVDDDKDNRVMYFYGDLKVNEVGFPASYPFIIGTLTNSSVYIAKNIRHTIPLPEDEELDIETFLDSHKLNYLESNNQRYFYKKYNSGEKYNTTGWRRFIIGKISRELEKNKWKYLGNKFTGIIKNTISEILVRVKNNFSMIRDIQITEFIPSPREETIDMVIDIETTDLVDNHITLDITINYNKQYE